MNWKKYTIETTTDAEDILSEELSELGACGIELEDNVPLTEEELKGMFVDLPLDLSGDDGLAKVSFYAEDRGDGTISLGGDEPRVTDERTLLAEVREMLARVGAYCNIGTGNITVSETKNVDWENNWKAYWHAFAVDRVVIKPSWEDLSGDLLALAEEGAVVLDMDPGTAFGTGSHETTQLCIRALQKYLKPGDAVLDVGTGSGILAITACALGADRAFGTDLDEAAVGAAAENAERNGVADRITVVRGNLIDPAETDLKNRAGAEYDIVTANILAPVIIELQKTVADYMKPGAYFLASGILDVKEEEVKAAIASNPALEICETAHQGEWVGIVARKVSE